ncbi:MAG TPA: phosphoribosylanthranilate isomerase [Terriglobales bacterium]|jgi:phosphoribosylanthranilate isomerase
MTWAKICGITNLEDALTAIDAGADALGFVFYEKSPRKITGEQARRIIQKLPSRIETVGVFVAGANGNIAEIAEQAQLSSVQVHLRGNATDSPSGPLSAGRKHYLAVSASDFFDQDNTDFSVSKSGLNAAEWIHAVFLDSGTAQQPGGTGKVFDWHKAVATAERIQRSGLRLVVAGGLTPKNVAEAMRVLKPWGVDVSSGVGAAPGKKDPEKVRAFIAAVKQADKAI